MTEWITDTASPAKEQAVLRVIEDGRSKFEAGKSLGERLKAPK